MPDTDTKQSKPRNIGVPPGLFISMREALRAVSREIREHDDALALRARDLVGIAVDAMDRWQDDRISGGHA